MKSSIVFRRLCGFGVPALLVLFPIGTGVQAQDERGGERDDRYIERRDEEVRERREERQRDEDRLREEREQDRERSSRQRREQQREVDRPREQPPRDRERFLTQRREERSLDQQRRGPEDRLEQVPAEQLRQRMNHIEQAIRHLREAGLPDEANRLGQVARRIGAANRPRPETRRAEQPPERRPRQNVPPEVAQAIDQLRESVRHLQERLQNSDDIARALDEAHHRLGEIQEHAERHAGELERHFSQRMEEIERQSAERFEVLEHRFAEMAESFGHELDERIAPLLNRDDDDRGDDDADYRDDDDRDDDDRDDGEG